MGSGCARCVGGLFVILAFLCCIGAVFGPTLLSTAVGGEVVGSVGFFLKCTFLYKGSSRDCEFDTGPDDKETWYLACQVLICAALACLLFCFFGLLSLCCNSESTSAPLVIAIFSLLAFACSTATVVLYVIKVGDGDAADYFKRTDNGIFFDWSLYLAMVTAVTSLFATITYMSLRSQNKNKVGSMY